VARIKRELLNPDIRTDPFQIGRAARVLQLWHSQPEYQDISRRPIDLAFDEGTPSFVGLVKLVGGDVPAGAVRAELLAAGGMVLLENGKYRVQQRFFVPATLDEDLIVGIAFIAAPMLETLEHNIRSPSARFFQRVVYSDHLTDESTESFKRLSHESASEMMASLDGWLGEHELKGPNRGRGKKRVGQGVFYFETKNDE
jgi:hypothetical protein